MMRFALVAAWTSVGFAGVLAFACGTQLAVPPGDDGGGVDATEPAEPPLDSFGCGEAARCAVRVQVCCLVAGNPTCAPIDCSGSVGEAGDASPAPQPLECTTYRVCNTNNDYGNECCWTPTGGSQCKDDCESDELRLCEEGDNCDYNFDCRPIPDDPLGPGIRRCVYDGSGSSNSGSSSSGGSSGHFPSP